MYPARIKSTAAALRRGLPNLGRSVAARRAGLATESAPAPIASKAASLPPADAEAKTAASRKLVFDNKRTFRDFMETQAKGALDKVDPADLRANSVPYLARPDGKQRTFYVEVYGCQMNNNDTEILNAILHDSGFRRTRTLEEADIVFLMTCAIRDGAEQKIWSRLAQLKAMRTKHGIAPQIGVLGCMAERLREKLLEQDKLVDVVCGPDAYRSLPALLALAEDNQQVANVMLSADETYADIMPLRLDPDQISAHLSIMRGCNNMCAFCIVPFTRGTERSRPIQSIVDEVRRLSEQGIREVTLLGQNVNSYRDSSAPTEGVGASLAPGFKTIYKRKEGGMRFAELLDRVADVDPEMRIRFTSPHPKDFPDDLLHVIRSKHNICNQIHMPAQSGSTTMLERMRRGYSREAFLSLVDRMRSIIPNVAISTDIIAGFCGETDAEHQDTVSLMRTVQFDQAFMFAYSMREKTHAHRRYVDDVPADVKQRRLAEIITAHFDSAKAKHSREFVEGRARALVLVEGLSRRGNADPTAATQQWVGRADNNLRVHFDLPADSPLAASLKGKYVAVNVNKATGASMSGDFAGVTTIREFYTGSPSLIH
ncbi:hypothetical protein H9P43_000470 [Blastocladiella emersonii ATCC 22665]|nr:hypothetical protein H9P43_000470 [Blastocladiella emersonii ATCC 22665]